MDNSPVLFDRIKRYLIKGPFHMIHMDINKLLLVFQGFDVQVKDEKIYIEIKEDFILKDQLIDGLNIMFDDIIYT